MKGDEKYSISTFATKYGIGTIAKLSTIALCLAYAGAISLPFLLKGKFKVLPMTLGHFAFLVYSLINYQKLDANDMTSVKKFYKSIRNLFYLEYILYPFI